MAYHYKITIEWSQGDNIANYARSCFSTKFSPDTFTIYIAKSIFKSIDQNQAIWEIYILE